MIMTMNVESMFYVRETPWHGLGTRVNEALNSKEALTAAYILLWLGEKADGYFEKERVNGKSQTEITLSGSFLMKICKQMKNRDGKR